MSYVSAVALRGATGSRPPGFGGCRRRGIFPRPVLSQGFRRKTRGHSPRDFFLRGGVYSFSVLPRHISSSNQDYTVDKLLYVYVEVVQYTMHIALNLVCLSLTDSQQVTNF